MVYTEATGDQPEDIQNASCVFITKPCAETTANQQVDANLCLCVYDSKTLDKKWTKKLEAETGASILALSCAARLWVVRNSTC